MTLTNVNPPGRPTRAEIDLDALSFNFRQIRKRISKAAAIVGVVKADAYGHGAVPVSLALERLGVEYLAVAFAEEGVELRKGGVRAPILLLGGIYGDDAEKVFRYHLTPAVFRTSDLEILSAEGRRRRRKAKVHLKLDTGMGRLGVCPQDWADLLKSLPSFPGIEAEGVLSHYAKADEEEDPFTLVQWKAFEEALAAARELGVSFKYVHISNSAGCIGFPDCCGNLVRPGIMLYGSYPSPSFEKKLPLKPLMTLKTRIHLLKTVPAGTGISYGGTFVTERESLLATLPIGYADGYSRRLSNQGEILVRGRRAPVVGRVTMDYIMADVTGIPNVSEGDEVVLLGRQGRERISADEIARKIGTIPYEVLCGIGKRVPRVHVFREADRGRGGGRALQGNR